MAEKKKRGLFSWLGFGSEEKTEQTEQTIENQTNEVDVDSLQSTDDKENKEALAQQEADALAQAKADEEAEALAIAKAAEEEALAVAKAAEEAEALAVIKAEEAEVAAKAEAEAQAAKAAEVIIHEQEKPQSDGFFSRLMRGLKKTKTNFGSGFFGLFSGKKIDDELFEELEEQLLIADVGMDTTLKIIENLTDKANRKELKDGEALYGLLKEELADMLLTVEQPLIVDTTQKPFVILMVGVNGVGKTTTTGTPLRSPQT